VESRTWVFETGGAPEARRRDKRPLRGLEKGNAFELRVRDGGVKSEFRVYAESQQAPFRVRLRGKRPEFRVYAESQQAPFRVRLRWSKVTAAQAWGVCCG